MTYADYLVEHGFSREKADEIAPDLEKCSTSMSVELGVSTGKATQLLVKAMRGGME